MGGCDDPRLFRGSWRVAGMLVLLLLLCAALVGAQPQQRGSSSLVSSVSVPSATLHPFEWTYLRFELPPSFSSMILTFTSDVGIDEQHMKDLPKSKLPVLCFKDGRPPLPDASDAYLKDSLLNFHFNGSFGDSQNRSVTDQCIPFQKNITLTWTTEQISPGIWYIGFFNGLGSARTQSKMINRGQSFKFSTQINVEGCTTSTLLGPYCNQTIDIMSCSQYAVSKHARNLIGVNNSSNFNQLVGSGTNNYSLQNLNTVQEKQVPPNSSMFVSGESLISCNNTIYSSCLGYGEFNFYFLDILGVIPQFNILATEIRFNQTSSVNNPANFSETALICYARYNEMPHSTLYDDSADISKGPLIINSPKIGRWYIAIQAVNHAKVNGGSKEFNSQANLCFSFEWQVHECLNGKGGLNCTWESYMLQRVLGKGSALLFDSYYVPSDENGPMEKEFPLENLLSNSSIDEVSWTYFFVNVPRGTAGTLHILLNSDTKLNYELYSKYGGLPSIDTWDYHVNSTSSSNGSLLVSDENGVDKIDFYISYANEGTWCFGLKHASNSRDKYQTTMSIAMEGCPRHCSSHGKCYSSIDQSGMAFYSYCSCDGDHGGFDCSDELVSPEGHIWQSIFLIASNGAAIFPAFWALRRKAYAEWVLFTASGISSGLYHACDVGTWCVLSFSVLQFMDFWLSFMAVVSTFVFMATIDEVLKRAIHTCVAICTALLALTGATRSENIIIVLAIGTLALLVAWMLEFSTTIRALFFRQGFDLNLHERWESIKRWFFSLVKALQKRFRWRFIFLGLIALAGAAVSWKLENSANYWIWHSLWHVTIYTSSFFFLYSTSPKSSIEPQAPAYQLTRQNSLSTN